MAAMRHKLGRPILDPRLLTQGLTLVIKPGTEVFDRIQELSIHASQNKIPSYETFKATDAHDLSLENT